MFIMFIIIVSSSSSDNDDNKHANKGEQLLNSSGLEAEHNGEAPVIIIINNKCYYH